MEVTCIENNIKLVKTALVKQCIVGDTISFIINIRNEGKKSVYDVSINDRLLPNLSFINGSLKVDSKNDINANIVSGINIGELEACSNKNIKFDVLVIDSYKDNSKGSMAFSNYSYINDENSNISVKFISSNKEEVDILSPKLDIVRNSNKNSVFIGENITLKTTIKNSGNIKIFNLIFKDNIPENTVLVDGTFNINARSINSVDIRQGIKIQSIKIGEIVTISYQLKILDKNCKSKLVSKVSIDSYCRLPIGIDKKLKVQESSIDINIAISNFKQVNLNGIYKINDIKPNILEINAIDCNVSIRNSSIINTLKATSIEGQRSTGYKMIVVANLETIMNYIADGQLAKIYSENYNSIFSTYIMLPYEFTVGRRVEIHPIVEKNNFRLIDKRSFFYEISILLLVKIH